MPAQIVSQHCKHWNKLARLARQERRAGDASPCQTQCHQNPPEHSLRFLAEKRASPEVLKLPVEPRDAAWPRPVAPTAAHRQGNAATAENKEGENSLLPSHSHCTEGLRSPQGCSGWGALSQLWPAPGVMVASLLSRQITCSARGPCTCWDLFQLRRMLKTAWSTARNKCGSFADWTLGFFLSPPCQF